MKQRLKQGFSILEFLIYLAACGVISLILAQWVVMVLKDHHASRLKNSAQLSLLSVLDCFSKDIYSAPTMRSQWNHFKKDKISWHKGRKKITYSFAHNKLYRSVKNNSLSKKASKQILLEHIINGSFLMQQKGANIIAATIDFSIKKGGQNHAQQRMVLLQNN